MSQKQQAKCPRAGVLRRLFLVCLSECRKLIQRIDYNPLLQSPFVSTAVTEAGVEDREVAADVFSKAGLGRPSTALREAAADRPAGKGRDLTWLCKPCPQIR